MSKTASLPLQLVRITVVGASAVGKTRLIDSFVNSPPNIGDEWSVGPTTAVELYHKLVTLPSIADDELIRAQPRALLELEDTPSSNLVGFLYSGDDASGLEVTDAELLELDDKRLQSPQVELFSMTRVEGLMLPTSISNLMPFGIFEYVRDQNKDGAIGCHPLSQGRMGFLIVFSMLSLASLREAIEIHTLISLLKQRRQSDLSAVVYLLANKEDAVDRTDPDCEVDAVMPAAEEYAARMRLPLYTVSAATGKNVRKAVEEMTLQIAQMPALSAFDMIRWGGHSDADEKDS